MKTKKITNKTLTKNRIKSNTKSLKYRRIIRGGGFGNESNYSSNSSAVNLDKTNDRAELETHLLKDLTLLHISTDEKMKEVFIGDYRKLNFIAYYIINNPFEVLNRILIFKCKTNTLHHCVYYNKCTLNLVLLNDKDEPYKIDELLEINKDCLANINKCLTDNSKYEKFILPIQITKKSRYADIPHYYNAFIVYNKDGFKIYLVDAYLSDENKYEMTEHDKQIAVFFKNIDYLKDKKVEIINTTDRAQCKLMPQAISKDLSCQIWSILYNYIYICSEYQVEHDEYDKLFNINPFFYMMIFLINVYLLYKYDVPEKYKKDISIKNTEYEYDFKLLNQEPYFNIRRLFLHTIENTTNADKEYYLTKVIEYAQDKLVRAITNHEPKKTTDFKKYEENNYILLEYIKKYGDLAKYKSTITNYLYELNQILSQHTQNTSHTTQNINAFFEDLKKKSIETLNFKITLLTQLTNK